MSRIGPLPNAITSRSSPATDATPQPQRASNSSLQNQRPHDERPLNRNPGANSGLASKLRNSVADHVKVRGTDGSMIRPVIVRERMLEELIDRWKSPFRKGYFVRGIPGTAPQYDVRSLTLLDLKTGKCVTAGTRNEAGELVKFSQQSMSKSVAEALAIKLLTDNGASDGAKAFQQRVGFDASGRAYNDHATYPDRPGVPFNSSVNIGALKTWDIIITEASKQNRDPFDLYLGFERQLAGNPALNFNEGMANGEFTFKPADGSESNNMQMLAKLESAGNLDNPREQVYRAYCKACAIMVNTEDSARVRASLRTGKYLGTETRFLPVEMADLLNRSTAVHGMYDESGRLFVTTGAAVKSGVDGGLMGSLPSKIRGNPDIIFASHHAALNSKGNSLEGDRWLQKLSLMPLIFADDEKISKASVLTKGLLRKVRGKTPHVAAVPMRSPEAMDRDLRAGMTEGGEQRLNNELERMLGLNYKGGFYLKEAKSAKSLNGAQLLLEEADERGNGKRYYRVPDKHNIEKVIVTSVTPSNYQLPQMMNELGAVNFGESFNQSPSNLTSGN